MIYCKTCGALLMDNKANCIWCKSDPNRESKVQRQTIVQMIVAIIVAVVAIAGFRSTTAIINTTVAARDISSDMSYEEVVDVIVQAIYITSDADTLCDAIHPKQLETYVRAANIDAVKGVEVQVTITKENGETFTETANMVLVHQNNRWYLDADQIL